jgi:hypothetical protein
LETLPPRHQETFDRLKKEIAKVVGQVTFFENKCSILEGFIAAHDLDPQAADDSYKGKYV